MKHPSFRGCVMVSPETGYHLYESPIQQKSNGGAQHLRSNRGTEPRLLGRCCVLCLPQRSGGSRDLELDDLCPEKKVTDHGNGNVLFIRVNLQMGDLLIVVSTKVDNRTCS